MATPALKDLPKVDVDLKSQLESFSPTALKSASTEEKCLLPTAEDVKMEKVQQLVSGIEGFDSTKLRHAETQEKNSLPDKDAVAAEKTHNALISGVEHFDKTTMKHAETEEKNPLPPIEGLLLFMCH
ncbi:hypothetical protein ACKWTF_006388 [Chironomus riparius]